jgi:hypothetical protein
MLDKAFKFASKRALKGNRLLALISLALAAIKLLRRMAGGGEKTIYSHKLESNQAVVITGARPKK